MPNSPQKPRSRPNSEGTPGIHASTVYMYFYTWYRQREHLEHRREFIKEPALRTMLRYWALTLPWMLAGRVAAWMAPVWPARTDAPTARQATGSAGSWAVDCVHLRFDPSPDDILKRWA